MANRWKAPLSNILRSWTTRSGIFIVLLRFLPDIQGWLDAFVFVRGNWKVVIDFLGSGWGTLTTLVFGMGLIAFATYRALSKKTAFPNKLYATYERMELDLNNIEDHISFIFCVKNETDYTLVLTNENNGNLSLIAGIQKVYFFAPWYAETTDGNEEIEPHSIAYLKIARTLEWGIAFHLAFKSEAKENVSFDFADMAIGFRTKKPQPKYGFINLPGETEIDVPNQPVYWKKYRDLHSKVN